VITYEPAKNVKNPLICVRLGGKAVGYIGRNKDGWSYSPNRGISSERFPTLAALKQSLEAP
jgi:hypothetical protein